MKFEIKYISDPKKIVMSGNTVQDEEFNDLQLLICLKIAFMVTYMKAKSGMVQQDWFDEDFKKNLKCEMTALKVKLKNPVAQPIKDLILAQFSEIFTLDLK